MTSVAVESPPKRSATAIVQAWREDPVRFVRDVFRAEPDAWQADVLRALLVDPRIAMSACKGPGKTTALAWCGWWILFCHKDAQGFAASITGKNLEDNLWKELAVWYAKSPLLQAAFTLNSERIAAKERPKTWWLSARSFPQQADASQQANTLAGLHGPYVFVLLDEVGDYPTGVISAAKGIFSVKGQRGWVLAAGNPTRINGGLHHICTSDAASWRIIHITGDPDDPKRSPRIDIDFARSEIAKWGRDNPWVMVNILGQFPPAGENQLISVNDVIEAMKRDVGALVHRTDATVWGVDPARSPRPGADEATLARRQGVLARKIVAWRGKDGPQLAAAIGRLVLDAEKEGEAPDAIFVDVGGIGASCYDHLKLLGWEDIVIPIDFGSAPDDPRFDNKRAEMWWEMAEWLKGPNACLPNDQILQGELVAPEFRFGARNRQTVFRLESKDEMRARGVPSPNRGDALALTFAGPVMPRSRHSKNSESGSRPNRALTDYDPLRRQAS